MNILLSSVGSRGSVQPLLALALELRALGHEPRLCVPPNFKAWVESFGLACIPIGPDLQQLARGAPVRASAEHLQQLAIDTVRAQFPVLAEAIQGCALAVAADVLQFATRSVAEARGVPYVFTAYAPSVLPSPSHPPSKMGTHYSQTLGSDENRALWREDQQSFDALFRTAMNEARAELGLAPVESVHAHIITDHPWLAADPVLAPAGLAEGLDVVQTGAWFMRGGDPLPERVERFLAAGEPPVYFGFGSMRSSEHTGPLLVEAARALGLRAIVSQGWGQLLPADSADDCLAIDDVDHEVLFPRVLAVVHHGGAGTTAAAARAGKGQVVVPHLYDQYYWAHRVKTLGIGVSGSDQRQLSTDDMVSMLGECLQPQVAARAQALAGRMVMDGARIAAQCLGRLASPSDSAG